jgi:hypothetical protein
VPTFASALPTARQKCYVSRCQNGECLCFDRLGGSAIVIVPQISPIALGIVNGTQRVRPDCPFRYNVDRSVRLMCFPSDRLTTNLRPEAELLLCCARLVLPPAESERMARLAQSNLDWPLVLELGARHRLLPLLHRHLDILPLEAVPRTIRLDLWVMHERTAQRNQVLTDELLNILQLLQSHGITAIPYKGPILAFVLYGDVALRPFEDLDVLVSPSDLPRARDLLVAQGYLPYAALQPTQEVAHLRATRYHHICLVHHQKNISVELHWKAGRDAPTFSASDHRPWGNLLTVNLKGSTVRHFAAEELLPLLCMHGAAHQWDSLGWLVDVAELIRHQPQLDWTRIMAAAAMSRGKRQLALGLYLAHHLLDAPLPEPVRAEIAAQPWLNAMACQVSQRLFQSPAPELTPLELASFRLKILDTWPQRIRDLLGAFNPRLTEWTRWPLPRYLSFLYYPLRLGRLLIDYGMRPLARHLRARSH